MAVTPPIDPKSSCPQSGVKLELNVPVTCSIGYYRKDKNAPYWCSGEGVFIPADDIRGESTTITCKISSPSAKLVHATYGMITKKGTRAKIVNTIISANSTYVAKTAPNVFDTLGLRLLLIPAPNIQDCVDKPAIYPKSYPPVTFTCTLTEPKGANRH
ncbi:MAG: hypothetical protein COB66_07445 [Coxiella sp. (in: Bacteria)]|nr:MAG: hypothetical protein COB66_07445 [Coxiella sp. (in: g-proteobacteria)]